MIIDTVIMVNNIKDPMGITIVPAIYGISCYVQWRSHIGTQGALAPPQYLKKLVYIYIYSKVILIKKCYIHNKS